jgi:hypothetical protein
MKRSNPLPPTADHAAPSAGARTPADAPPPSFDAQAMPILATHWFGLLADERQAA